MSASGASGLKFKNMDVVQITRVAMDKICVGSKCALCCTLFSIWGVGMLVVLAAKLDYRGVSLMEISDIDSARTNMYIAAACYGIFVVFCGLRFAYLLMKGYAQSRAAAAAAGSSSSVL
ncbi:hypothetical protein Pelo_14695 [Pelomyxa schiedti]|nr:hypothetical protein Pelo_14695 [Pelomyxa schiedti]